MNTSIYSLESVDSRLQQSGQDSEQLPSANGTSSAKKSFEKIFQMSLFSEISENSTERNTKESNCSQEDSHVNRSASLENKKERMMTAISGRKCLELFPKRNPLGLLARTLLVSSTWRSTKYLLTWKLKVTPLGRLLFQLAPSAHHTEETECGSWPTPTATDYKGASGGCKKLKNPTKLCYRVHPMNMRGTTYPHPIFVEHLMGYPIGWTELDPSETQ